MISKEKKLLFPVSVRLLRTSHLSRSVATGEGDGRKLKCEIFLEIKSESMSEHLTLDVLRRKND